MGLLVEIVSETNADIGRFTMCNQVYVVNCPGNDANEDYHLPSVALQELHTGEFILVPVDDRTGKELRDEFTDNETGALGRYIDTGAVCGSFNHIWRRIVEPNRHIKLPSFCVRLFSQRQNFVNGAWKDIEE